MEKESETNQYAEELTRSGFDILPSLVVFGLAIIVIKIYDRK